MKKRINIIIVFIVCLLLVSCEKTGNDELSANPERQEITSAEDSHEARQEINSAEDDHEARREITSAEDEHEARREITSAEDDHEARQEITSAEDDHEARQEITSAEDDHEARRENQLTVKNPSDAGDKHEQQPDENTDDKNVEIQESQASGDIDIRIGIIDTGFSSSVINPDCILQGKNYVFPEQDTEDRIGHGTALAAFIVGSVPSRIDGECPEAKLIPLVYTDVFQDEQVNGGFELVTAAVYDAVDLFGCDIILISSGTTKDDEALHEAVRYAWEKGVMTVSCAGNSGDTEPDAVFYPGAYEEVLCVGSVNEEGEKSYFSQDNEFVDVWEIGSDLRLATLKGTRIRGQGTSYSAAIVAGKAAALMRDKTDISVQEVWEELTAQSGS